MEFVPWPTLQEMTGYKQKARVAARLRDGGVRYTLDAHGRPKVPLAALERLYGVSGRLPAAHGVDIDALAAIGLG